MEPCRLFCGSLTSGRIKEMRRETKLERSAESGRRDVLLLKRSQRGKKPWGGVEQKRGSVKPLRRTEEIVLKHTDVQDHVAPDEHVQRL